MFLELIVRLLPDCIEAPSMRERRPENHDE